MTFKNQFANGRFARTEPREWRHIPWHEDRRAHQTALKVLGIVLLWICIAALSLYSISESVEMQRSARVTK